MRSSGCGLVLALLACPALAEGPREGKVLYDVTMEVVADPDADESQYVEQISLPVEASATDNAAAEARASGAGEGRAFGQSTAEEARTQGAGEGRAFGQSTADETRSVGRDAANAAKAGGGPGGTGGGPPEDLPVQVP